MLCMRVLACTAVAFASSGNPVPSDILCNSKLLAYDFALKLMPERGAAGLAPVASG